jgi:hypothetical protein
MFEFFLLKFQICSVRGKIFFWYNGGGRHLFLIDSLPSMQCFSMLCTCFFCLCKAWRINQDGLATHLCDKISPYLFINSQFFQIARDSISTYSMKREREREKKDLVKFPSNTNISLYSLFVMDPLHQLVCALLLPPLPCLLLKATGQNGRIYEKRSS